MYCHICATCGCCFAYHWGFSLLCLHRVYIPYLWLEFFFGVCVFCKLVLEVNYSMSFGNLTDFGPLACDFTIYF